MMLRKDASDGPSSPRPAPLHPGNAPRAAQPAPVRAHTTVRHGASAVALPNAHSEPSPSEPAVSTCVLYVHTELAGPAPDAKGGPRAPAAPAPSTSHTVPARARPEAAMSGTARPSRAVTAPAPRTAARGAGAPDALTGPERAALARHVRRVWMGSALKRMPHTLLLVSLRLAPSADGERGVEALGAARQAVTTALAELGPVFALSPRAVGLVIAGRSLRQGARLAERIRTILDERANLDPAGAIILAAGLANLHRGDDPLCALCLAERCLAAAEHAHGSCVLTETHIMTGTIGARPLRGET